MNNAVTFEDLENINVQNNSKSFASLDLSSDSDLLNWLTAEIEHIKSCNRDRFEKIKNNILRCKNITYLNQLTNEGRYEYGKKKATYTPNISMPYLRDIVDEKTARLMELKPSVTIVPLHNEESDKASAKVAKRFIKHIERQENLESKLMSLVQGSKIMGEKFMVIRWNPDKGAIVGVGENQVFLGDVDLPLASPFELFVEESEKYEDAKHAFFFEYCDTDEMRLDYPECASSINSESRSSFYDFNDMSEKTLRNKSLKITFWHKKTKHVPSGFECTFVINKILAKGALKYDHGQLPLVRLPDVLNENELHGEAQIEFVRGIASQINNMNNMATKQTNLAAHPKWFVDAGSVDDSALGNDIGIVKVKAGASRPVLAQSNPVSPQVFQQIQDLEQKFYKLGKSNSVVQGAPPAGVTAFVALQYVSESESRRLTPEVINLKTATREIYSLILKTAAQFYKSNDKRTLMILGPEGKWDTESLDPVQLRGPFAVEIQDASTLPDSKAARTQYLIDLSAQFPEQFEKEQLMEMLGFTQSERFVDEVQRASISAESENESMLEGTLIAEPESYELHIVHWKSHTKIIQDVNFKTKTPIKVQNAMLEHIGVTEMLMLEAAEKNPLYAQKLALLTQFPLVYEGPLLAQVKAFGMQAMGMAPAMPEAGPMPEEVAAMPEEAMI